MSVYRRTAEEQVTELFHRVSGGMMELMLRVMAVTFMANLLRVQGAEEDSRASREEIRENAGSVVSAREKMAKTMTKFAMVGGILNLFGAILPNVPLGETLNPHRATAAEFFKTAGKGMDSGNQVQNMHTEAKIYNFQTNADLSKQGYEVNWTRQQEFRNSNRSIKDELQQMIQQLFGWFQKLWQS
jgi:hypothetical protein